MTRTFDIGLFAPAGVVIDPDTLDRAAKNLLARGHRVVEDIGSREREQRFAGDDRTRIAAIERMAARSDVEVAIAIRGGYGFSRLLERLDYAALARAGKRWIGHSDFTAFQLAALARAGMVTYAGPMAYDFGAEAPSDFTWRHCFGLLEADEYAITLPLEGPSGRTLEGTLWGSNLAMIGHMVGTPFLPAVEGGLLFLEDVSEHPYRVERMLYQLHHAGILARQRAILIGAFTEYELFPHDGGYDLHTVVAHLRSMVDVPVYTGLPFGHIRDKLTLPVGCKATLKAGDGHAELVLRHRA